MPEVGEQAFLGAVAELERPGAELDGASSPTATSGAPRSSAASPGASESAYPRAIAAGPSASPSSQSASSPASIAPMPIRQANGTRPLTRLPVTTG